MQRWEIINKFITERGYTDYLEIGVLGSECFDNVECENKTGVDPGGNATYIMTSDKFFEDHPDKTFDIVFIDGLHFHEQVSKDIENSIKALKPGGIIVMHDCLPQEEYQQRRDTMNNGTPWTGDTWIAFAKLRLTRPDLEMYVVDTDWGCGVINPDGTQTPFTPLEQEFSLDWGFFFTNRNQLMNVKTVEEFCGR